MRIGQTSAVQFGSKILISAAGFLATLYFARVVGADTLGIYFLLLSAMAWLSILLEAGISESITKRMSEGSNRWSYFVVGSAVIVLMFGVIAIGLLAATPYVTQYADTPLAAGFLIGLIGASAARTIVNAGLNGSHNVHVAGILNALQSVLRVAVQVGAVAVGLGLIGLVGGWVIASGVVALLGTVFLWKSLEISTVPDIEEFRTRIHDLFSYAKYSWLGSIKAKTNNYADILILGFFVPNGLIGVYAVSWNIASFLTIFGAAIHETLFPEISRVSGGSSLAETERLIGQSLQYTGLFVIPGLFGGAVLGRRILRLYGSDFVIGTTVLYLLIIAVLLFDYQKQLTNALNGMDRPNLAFKVNAVFVASNLALNVGLIALLGWIGAAIATAVASGIGLVYSYRLTNKFVEVRLPLLEIGKQVVSSIIMSGVVVGLLWLENIYGVVNSNVILVVGLVVIGAAVYLGVLLVLSADTRAAILRNLGLEEYVA